MIIIMIGQFHNFNIQKALLHVNMLLIDVYNNNYVRMYIQLNCTLEKGIEIQSMKCM
jgi:hypothetical protein